jgi:hypothetical protein
MRARRVAAVLAFGVAATIAAGWVVRAQQPASGPNAAEPQPPAPTTASPPVIEAPPPPRGPESEPASNAQAAPSNEAAVVEKPQAKPSQPAPPPPPPAPVLPVRAPAAILQALDKVTAETIRFAAPVGQRIRYKNLVFTVKACETTGLADPAPQASAYLTIESQPLAVEGRGPPPAKVVYRGWMFSSSPGLHPLEHPVYDAWLIACMASAPPA